MTTVDFKAQTGRTPPTEAERRAAARIRVNVDKKLGNTTPTWIVKLAQPHKATKASRTTR